MDKNVCRICLQESIRLIDMREQLHKGFPSPYEQLLMLKIEMTATGPASICSQCCKELEDSVAFVEKCKRANTILASQYYSNETAENSTGNEIEQVLETSPETKNRLTGYDPKDSGYQETSLKVCAECKSRKTCIHRPTVYSCQYCCKHFTKKFNYTIHIKRHLGQREHPCVSCGCPQVSRWLARAHCRTRERRACPEPGCRRTYTSTHNLNTHMLTHTGEKPHECADCGKRFTSKNTLKDHIRTHTGVKPFLCSECGARFATNKLCAHRRRAHTHTHAHAHTTPPQESAPPPPPPRLRNEQKGSLACPHCAMRYSHKQSLNRHLKKRHPHMQVPDASTEQDLKGMDCFM